MLNEGDAVEDPKVLKVLDGIELAGRMNIDDGAMLANVRAAMVRPYPQVKPHPHNPDLVALVGSGPSLKHTEQELRDLVFQGGKVATVNGSYRWCIERNIKPSVQIVMDGRASNARFLEPEVPRCRYILASQCAPETWDAVEGRDAWMFHAVSSEADGMKEILDRHFLGQWYGVSGGTTVVTRALYLLRMLGFMRFELFGVDSCWMGSEHHAFPQVENEQDRWVKVTAAPPGSAEGAGRTFIASPWHLKQAEDLLQLIRVNGDHFLMNVHGDGLIAYLLQSSADIVDVEEMAAAVV